MIKKEKGKAMAKSKPAPTLTDDDGKVYYYDEITKSYGRPNSYTAKKGGIVDKANKEMEEDEMEVEEEMPKKKKRIKGGTRIIDALSKKIKGAY